jgi:hypothetical protein
LDPHHEGLNVCLCIVQLVLQRVTGARGSVAVSSRSDELARDFIALLLRCVALTHGCVTLLLCVSNTSVALGVGGLVNAAKSRAKTMVVLRSQVNTHTAT